MLDFSQLYIEYLDEDHSLDDIRTIVWADDNGFDIEFTKYILSNFNNYQARQIIVLPDLWPCYKEYIKQHYSPRLIGLIRDLFYFGYNLEIYNFDLFSDNEITYFRSKKNLPNMYRNIVKKLDREENLDALIDDNSVDFDQETEIFEQRDISYDLDSLLDLLTDDSLDVDINTETFFESQELDDDEFFLRETNDSFINYFETQILPMAILLDPKDEKNVFDLIDDKDYYERFFYANIRLAFYYASKYKSIINNCGFEDIIQECLVTILKVMEKFDSSTGNKFSTLAHFHLLTTSRRYIYDNDSIIRVPVHRQELMKKNLDIRFEEVFITMTEINYKELLKEDFNKERTEYDINDDFIYADMTDSLEAIDSEELTRLINEKHYYYDQEALYDDFNETLLKLTNKNLTEREKNILIQRFGLFNQGPKTLEEIGLEEGVTRERIRQIESKALRKLKRYKSELKIYMGLIE